MDQQYDVLIVDDHQIVREGLKSLLSDVPWARIVGEARTVREVFDMDFGNPPHLILIDPNVSGDVDLDSIKQIKAVHPFIKVLALTANESEDWVYKCLEAGVNGYVVKKSPCSELLMAAQTVLDGKTFLSPGVLVDVAKVYLEGRRSKQPEALVGALTHREREVFQLVGQGHKNREIAELLYISIKTVEKHRATMMRKLRLKSPADVRRLWVLLKDTFTAP
ncbi:MAG: response regulator transcription factor [Proteobacteria bacterium]|nr:response regulator transcription factor [Pseudomonadota bacterium]